MAKYCCENFKNKVKEKKFKADKNELGEYAYFAKGVYLLAETKDGELDKTESWEEMEDCPYCHNKFENEDNVVVFPKHAKHSSSYPEDSDPYGDPIYNLRKDGLFHIGQCYEDEVASTLVCEKCGSDKFYVGVGSYFTAIKCINCKWEECIHAG